MSLAGEELGGTKDFTPGHLSLLVDPPFVV